MATSPLRDEAREVHARTLPPLRQIASDDPAVWAAVLHVHNRALERALPPDEIRTKTTPLEPSVRKAVEEAIARGRETEPTNAFWDLAEMTLRLGEGDYEAAARTLHRAAAARAFDGHVLDIRDAVRASCLRLRHSDFRAKLTADELTGWLPLAYHTRQPVRAIAFETGLRESVSPGDAADVYRDVLRLNTLVRRTPCVFDLTVIAPWPASLARAMWEGRYEALEPEPDWRADSEVRAAWHTRALRSAVWFARDRNDAALGDAIIQAQLDRSRTAAELRRRLDDAPDLFLSVFLAGYLWWAQVILLAQSTLAVGAAGVYWAAARLVRAKAGKRWRKSVVAIAVSTVTWVAVQTLIALAPPPYGMRHVPPPTAWTHLGVVAGAAIPWLLPVVVGVVVASIGIPLERPIETWHIHERPEPLVGFSLALAQIGLGFYLTATLLQAAIQAYWAGIIV